MISIEGEECEPMDTGGHGGEKWKVLCAMLTTKCFIFFPPAVSIFTDNFALHTLLY